MTPTIKTFLVVVVIALVAWGIYAVMTPKGTNGEPIKIGAIYSLTGSGAAYGEPARDGVILAAQNINDKGGINGRPIEVIFEDSQFKPAPALSAYQSLKARGVKYFLTNGSSVAVSLAKSVIEDGNLLFANGATTPLFKDGKPNTCRAALTADVSGKVLSDFIIKKLGVKAVSFLTLNDDYGNAMRDNILREMENNNVTITAMESFILGDTDFRMQISKIQSQKQESDALVVIPAAGQAEEILKQLKQLRWKRAIVSDNWTIVNQNLKNLSLAEGVYFSDYDWQSVSLDKDASLVKRFKESFRERFNYDSPVNAAITYDEVGMLTNAFHAVGDQSPQSVSEWLAGNIKNYHGVSGSITLDSDCEGTRPVVIRQVRDGQFVKYDE